MDIQKNKITGIILLCLGLALIGFSLFSSYNIFTKKTKPPLIFIVLEQPKEEEKKLEVSQDSQKELTGFIEDSVKKQMGSFLPIGYISHFFNLASWSILAWIFIVGGFYVASLGIKLMKN